MISGQLLGTLRHYQNVRRPPFDFFLSASCDRYLANLERVVMRQVLGQLLALLAGLLGFAGWGQHLYTCFNEKLWGFLIAGAIFVPVGVIHGIGIWLGWWQ